MSGRTGITGSLVPFQEVTVDHSNGLIGEGGFGSVYKARFRGMDVAYKQPIEKTNIPKPKHRIVLKEAEKLIQSTSHPFIVKLFGVVLEQSRQGLILEYMHFGSCTDFIYEYDVGVPLRLKFLRDIINAMTWLHSFTPPIRHLDLKAENVLINNQFDAKISDFGLSEWKTATTVSLNKQRHGTITHVPPEVFNDINKKGSVEEDVYAFGITTWEIFSGQKPYADCNGEMIRTSVICGQRPDINKVVPQCPRIVADIMRLAWDHQPRNRPTFQKLEEHFSPVYNAAFHQLKDSIEHVRREIADNHGTDSEQYICTNHFENGLNVQQLLAPEPRTPVRHSVDDNAYGERQSNVAERPQELESTPRQDGLETNVERQFSVLSVMSPDGQRSPDDSGDGSENSNNDKSIYSAGFVSLKGKRYVPGHEIKYPKGVVVHPSDAPQMLSGVFGESGREDEKTAWNENVQQYVRRLSETNPDIAENILSNPGAMNSFERFVQSKTPETSPTELMPETVIQLLSTHGAERSVVDDRRPADQKQQGNMGITTGIISADQQRSSIETSPHPPDTPVTQPPVTNGNQTDASVSAASESAPNLVYPTRFALDGVMQHNDGVNRPVFQEPRPGTFDNSRGGLVQMPNTAHGQHAPVQPAAMANQIFRPPILDMQSSTNTKGPASAVPQVLNTPFNVQPQTNTSRNPATASTPHEQRSQERRQRPQTANQSQQSRPGSRSQRSTNVDPANTDTSKGPVTIHHKHNDGAFTTITMNGPINFPANMQIGNNMTMYVNNGGNSNSNNETKKLKKKTQLCKKSDLTVNNSVPELDMIDLVCVEVGNDWKKLFRQLDLSEPEIEQLQYDYHNMGLYETVYQGIRSWKQKNGCEATVRKLAIALWEVDRSDIAMKLH